MVAGAPGVTVEPTWDHLGLRASRSDHVVFVDTPVTADHAVELAPPTPPAASTPTWRSGSR